MKKSTGLTVLLALLLIILLPSALGGKGIENANNNKSNLFPKKSYAEDMHDIDQASEFRIAAGGLAKLGKYDEAAKLYEKAYEIDRGSRAVSGLLLAMTYEKLAQYDKGVILLDQMIQNGVLSPNGVKNADELKSRLLAAKQAKTNP